MARQVLSAMHTCLQAHSFTAAKRKADDLWAGLASYKAPVIELPPLEAEVAPADASLSLSLSEDHEMGEHQPGGLYGGQCALAAAEAEQGPLPGGAMLAGAVAAAVGRGGSAGVDAEGSMADETSSGACGDQELSDQVGCCRSEDLVRCLSPVDNVCHA